MQPRQEQMADTDDASAGAPASKSGAHLPAMPGKKMHNQLFSSGQIMPWGNSWRIWQKTAPCIFTKDDEPQKQLGVGAEKLGMSVGVCSCGEGPSVVTYSRQ